MFDRGCFHAISWEFAPDYAQSIASWANPGARFLLICLTYDVSRLDPSSKEELEQLRETWKTHISKNLEVYFETQESTTIDFPLVHSPTSRGTKPGLCVKLLRKE